MRVEKFLVIERMHDLDLLLFSKNMQGNLSIREILTRDCRKLARRAVMNKTSMNRLFSTVSIVAYMYVIM